MTEVRISEILLDLVLLFGLAYLLAVLLERVHIPGILGATQYVGVTVFR